MLADRLYGTRTPFLEKVSRIAAGAASELEAESLSHRESCELAAHGLLLVSGIPDKDLQDFVAERNRQARYQTMREFGMSKAEAEREMRSILNPVPEIPILPVEMAVYLRQFAFHVPAPVASLYLMGSTSPILVTTKAFAAIAAICGRVGKDIPRPVPSAAMAESLAFAYPHLVNSGILCVRDAIHLTEMLDGSTDADRTQLILSWITPVVRPSPRALPSGSAVLAESRIKTDAALLYAFFVAAVLHLAKERTDARLHEVGFW